MFLAEKRAHPVPEAAFKVGESSVEIGAHYFQRVLGLEPHLREQQLEKFGLRYFFPAGGNRRVEARFELGPSGFPPVPSFQLDRGRLENMLLRTDRDAGVDVRDDCRVTGFEFGASLHRLEIQSAGRTEVVEGRWLVDASGRSGLDPAPARPDAARSATSRTRAGSASLSGSRSTTGPRTRPGRRACRPGSAG